MMKLNYDQAYTSLAALVDEIEDDSIQLDSLAEKIKKAKELIVFCETKLREIDQAVSSTIGDKEL